MDNNHIPPEGGASPQPSPQPPLSAAPRPVPMAPPPLPVTPVATPAPRSKGRGWMIVALLLLLMLVGSLMFNFISAFGGLEMDGLSLGQPRLKAGPNLVEVLVREGESNDKLAVLHVEGLIASAMGGDLDLPRLIEAQLKLAEEDKRVKGVVLVIDSPGGEVLASDRIYQLIRDFQNKTQKPVVASMSSLAASGGYYVAAPCRWIVAHDLTITGSIGVIMQGYNYRGLMNKIGLRPEVYKSGKFKDMLSGAKDLENMNPEERKLLEEERRMVQKLIDEAFETFKSRVKEGRAYASKMNRAPNLRPNWEEYADGRILSGRQALEHGFVDQLGTFDDAVKYTARLAGVTDPKLVTYGVPFDFTRILRLLGRSETTEIKVDLGVKVPQLKSGCLYYLSPHLF
ncbi:MAG: signal peptide peptidase SppA [Verrucomicrobiae bacterium]|nr:signal peptide peptidase SppA [Verrucomicrobiae bacterium]